MNIKIKKLYNYFNNMGSQKQIGENIKKIREQRGTTQEELADKVGVHVSYISRIERGVVNPSVEVLENIAKALKVKSSKILPF
jgi:transcriptional regulator with XRE-family HTH domain